MAKPRREREERSDAELREVSKHLCFEIQMFYGSLEKLDRLHRARVAGEPLALVVHNALMESWTVHLRSLHDFFFKDTNARKNDAVALDFFDEQVWQALRGTCALGVALDRVAREVVHLTYSRIALNDETKKWDLEALRTRMTDDAIRPFVESVPVPRVQPGFYAACNHAISLKPLAFTRRQ